jgi:hypothetical protein
VYIQLSEQVNRQLLLLCHQSAVRTYHSTKTATVSVLNDITGNLDMGHVRAWCFLNMPAAVNHTILLDALKGNVLRSA